MRMNALLRVKSARSWVALATSLVISFSGLVIPNPANAAAGDPGSIQLASGSYLEATGGVNQVVPNGNWTIEGYVKLDVTGNQKYVLRGYSGVNGTTKEIEIYNGPQSYWAMKSLVPNETNYTGLMGSYTSTDKWLRFVFQQNATKACGTVQYTDSNPTSAASWKFGGVWVCTGNTSTNGVNYRRDRLTSTAPITKWVIGSNEPGQGLTAKFSNVHISNVARYSFDSNLAFPADFSSVDENSTLLIGTTGDANNYLDVSGNSTVTAVNTVTTSSEYPFLGPASYTVTFNGNGSDGGSMAPQSARSAQTLTTNGFTKSGYRFVGWNTLQNGSGTWYTNGGAYPFTSSKNLYAQWAVSDLAVTYNSEGGSLVSGDTFAVGGTPISLPTPTRQGYVFNGWFTAAVGGTLIGKGGAGYSPTQDTLLRAQWTQASLVGLSNPVAFGTITATNGNDGGIFARRSGTSVNVDYAADSLPDGTIITAYLQGDKTHAVNTIPGAPNVLLSVVVAWKAPDASVPLVDPAKPIRVTISNPNIRAGAQLYAIVGGTSTLMGTAAIDGQAVISLTEDPEIAVVNPSVVVSAGSLEFDGNGVVTYPTNNNFYLDSDYTVELWLKSAGSKPRGGTEIISRWKSGSTEYRLYANSNSQLTWNQKTSTGEVNIAFDYPALNAWHHIAAVRSGNNMKVFVDGVSVGTGTFTGSAVTAGSSPLEIGGLNSSVSGFTSPGFVGRISNVRISKSALYSSNFTPDSGSLVADATTSLLMNMAPGANYLVDSSNASIATTTGTPVSTGDVPFAANVPAPPSQVRGTSFEGTTSTITWNASAEVAGQGANTYTVYGSNDGISYSEVTGCVGVSGTTCSTSGLTLARGYVFKAKARNNAGYSEYSLLEANSQTIEMFWGSYFCSDENLFDSKVCNILGNKNPYTTTVMPTPTYCKTLDGTTWFTDELGIFDADGAMYFVRGNTIRKMTNTTFTNTHTCSSTLLNNSALLKSPLNSSLGMDAQGNLYVSNADSVDKSMIKISPDGAEATTYLTTEQTGGTVDGIKFDSDQNLIGYINPTQSIAYLVKFANITKTKSYMISFDNATMEAIGGNKAITGVSLNAFDDVMLSMIAGGRDYVIKFDHSFIQPSKVSCPCTVAQANQNKAANIYDASRTLYPNLFPETVKIFASFIDYSWARAAQVDSEGNTWVPQQLHMENTKLDPNGVTVLSARTEVPELAGPSMTNQVRIDPAGNVWASINNANSQWVKFAGATKPFLRQLTYKGAGSVEYGNAKSDLIRVDGATGSVNFKTTNTGSFAINTAGEVSAGSNLEPGKYAVSGTALDSANTAGTWTYTLTVTKAQPTVALTSSANPSIVQNSVTYTATPSAFDSGTVITFKDGVTTFGTCTVTLVSCSYTDSSLGAGSRSITAVSAESAHYLTATSNTVTQSIGTISTGTTWSVSNNPTQGQTITFSANVLPVAATGTVTFKDSNNNTLCTTGNLVSGTATCDWTGNPTRGNYSVTPTYSGDANYSVAAGATRAVSINANQSSLSWNLAGTSVPYLGTLDLATTGGSGSGAVVYSVSQGSTCTVSGSTLVAGDAGSTCEVTATKVAADNYYAASTSSQVITISKIDQANTLTFSNSNAMTYGQTLTLNATGGSGSGAVTYLVTNQGSTGCAISGSTLTVTGAGTCAVNASRAGSTNYNTTGLGSQATQSITVSTAPQTLRFTSTVPSAPVVGGSYVAVASSSSSLTPTLAITSGSCTISGSTVSFSGTGNCVVSATQSGDSQYSAATAVTQTIAVGSRNQTLSFNSATTALVQKTYGDTAFSVVASSTEVSAALVYSMGANTTNSACAVTSYGVVTVSNVGDCEIKVNSAGTAAFAAASEITKLIQVVPDLPGAPFLTSTSAGNRSITTTFTPPTYTGGSAITGYQLVAVDQTSGSVVTVTESGCATTLTNGFASCTVRGLENGVNYKVKVASVNAAGTGPFSELSQTLTAATNPAAVQQLQVTEDNSSLVISWADPDSLGGGTFSAYRVFVKRSSAANYDQLHYFNVTNSSTRTVTVSQESPSDGIGFNGGPALANGVSYDVKVVTVTTANASELTANTAEANKVPRTVPAAPELVEPLEIDSNLVLTWTAPVNDGGSTITAYTVAFNSTPCVLTNATDTTCVVTKPTTPGSYTYQVTAQNVAGASLPATRTFIVADPTPVPNTAPGATSSIVVATPSPSVSLPAKKPKSSSAVGSPSPTQEATESVAPTAKPSESPSPEAVIETQEAADTNTYGGWLWWLLVVLLVLTAYFGLRRQRGRHQ
jgi:uncharacterized repeat protein (TIGR02543 family)